jgi:hypothetical protein
MYPGLAHRLTGLKPDIVAGYSTFIHAVWILLNVQQGVIIPMKKIWYSILLGLVAFATGSILSYLVEGKINWIPALGPAIGVVIASFFIRPK